MSELKGRRVLVTWPSWSLLPLLRQSEPQLKTYRANEAGVVPGMPQGFDKFVTSLHGEIAAVTLGAEQIDIVWNERQSEDQPPGRLGGVSWPYQPNVKTIPQITGLGAVSES